MRETLELRVVEEEAHRVFRPDEGVVLTGGSIRKVLLPLDDERVPSIGALQRELRKRKKRPFFFGWDISRRYSEKELQAAELFLLWPQATFEPEGEACGTRYDESKACSHCGVGARQVSELALDLRCVPKRADIARTIANEIIVSTRLVEAMQARGITGAEFRPVRQAGKKGVVSSAWQQLVVVSPPVEIVEPTVTGNNPFDLDEQDEYRCPHGHTAGLNRLSELHVARKSYDGSDWACTRQMFSQRVGVIRPHPYFLISPKLRALLVELKVRRLTIEVAHPR
jgi:hypothetical protein